MNGRGHRLLRGNRRIRGGFDRFRRKEIDRWPSRSRTGPHSEESGSVTVESVLVVPVLMLVLTVMMQMVLWAQAIQVVHLAASEGARAGVSGGGGADVATLRAREVLAASGSDVLSPDTTAHVLSGDQISVTVSGQAMSLLPWLSLPVSATQMGPIQEFRSTE